MHLISKEVFIPGRDGRPVFPGFVSYLSADEPVLIHRSGWVDASDSYDDFADRFSHDNGATWSEPVLKLQSHLVPEGRIRYAENACFFGSGAIHRAHGRDKSRHYLLTLCSRGLYYGDRIEMDTKFEVVWDELDPATGRWRGEQAIPHDLPGGLGISFCFPLMTRSGRLLVPAYSILMEESGKPAQYPGYHAALETALLIRGTRIPSSAGGSPAWDWELSETIHVDPEQTSRGFSENALAELADGRIAMVMRGDNGAYPERLGHKWLAFSEDEGLTWSAPQPLGCADGGPIESGSNGCALARSITDGRLYFIGNLAADGERAKANWPRSPLVIAEVQEEPFALKRETITELDRRQPGEPPLTQMSNFRFYQDRQTGDMVVFLSRYGEKDPDNFKLADYYRYRVAL